MTIDDLSIDDLSIDEREQQLVSDERLIARLRARQMANLAVLDEVQVHTGDGARSLSEWVAARLDQAPETAKTLVGTMRRLRDRPDLVEDLVAGELSFDRVEVLSRLDPDRGLMLFLDVAGVRREASKHAGVSADAEYRSVRDRFLVIQPSLDGSWYRGWFGLDGVSGALVDETLTAAADQLPDLADGTRPGLGWRKATALTGLCVSDEAGPAQVTVLVDATEAAASNGEAGVVLEAGPTVGRRALQAILCDADTEVIARTSEGRYLDYGRRQRTVPPALKRALLDRWAGACAAAGCNSRYRLQAHHLTPWHMGGGTNQDELILLCWFHHQVVVHERGFQVIIDPETGQVRFHQPDPPPGQRPI